MDTNRPKKQRKTNTLRKVCDICKKKKRISRYSKICTSCYWKWYTKTATVKNKEIIDELKNKFPEVYETIMDTLNS
jgi:hypothetical protein